MKHLPRAWNRILLFLGGLVFLALGVGLVLTAVWKQALDVFTQGADAAEKWYTELVERSYVALGGVQEFSWMTIAWVAIAILIALLALGWLFTQGGGKTKQIELPTSESEEGNIIPKLGFVDALLDDVFADEKWVASTKTSAWQVKGTTGIAIDVNAYKGADPAYLKEVLDADVARLDSVLGTKVPVRVYLTTNLRARLGSAERVD